MVFLNRGGSPVPAEGAKISGDELTFMVGGTGQNRPTVTLRAAGNKLTGTVGQVKVAGERPPTWGACDANGSHAFGKPVTLFDGKSLDAWGVQMKDRPIGWSIEDGVMTNQPKANNLVSKEKFRDFRLDAEYKLSEKGNSGIYLRGRYEMQVLDDFGRTDDREHGHMSIYSRKAPLVNASKKAGEWQTAQITIVGNCVSATLNGQKIHDNSKIAGDHRRCARRQGNRARPAHDPGRPREGVVPEGRGDADRQQAEQPVTPADPRFSRARCGGGAVLILWASSLRAAPNIGFKRPRPARHPAADFRSSTDAGHNHTVAAGRCMHGKHHRE